MTLKIALTREQEARLRSEAEANSVDVTSLIAAWVNSLPGGRRKQEDGAREVEAGAMACGIIDGSGSLDKNRIDPNTTSEVRSSDFGRMTPREILAFWAEDKTPSVYARTGEDAVTIARRLRQNAERRGRTE